MIDDPYETPCLPVPIGEHCITIHEDGHVTGRRKEPDEHSSIWKNARKILNCSDDAISVIARRKSGVVDYMIDGVGVSWGHGKTQRYFCHGHKVNLCPHTKRLEDWRKDHE